MNSLEIVEEYKKEIVRNFDEMLLIIYGSTAFGVNTSDLDLCFIRDEELDKSEFESLVELTRDFHKKYNLRIDEEVPYQSKLIYTHSFIENTFTELPFPFIDGKYIIPEIEKTKQFLASQEMKKRLLLNILTVKRLVLNGNSEIIEKYSDRAWEEILKVVISYSEKLKFSVYEILDNLYMDPFNKNDGEMYLGYKTNLPDKKIYLFEEVSQQLENLTRQDKLVRTRKKEYIVDKNWLNS